MKCFAIAASLLGLAAIASATPEPSTTVVERAAQVDSSAEPIVSILVGPNQQLVFDPPFIQGPVGRGQRIHFDFRAANHTFTESTFERPCTKAPFAQFDTDFNNANPDDITNFKPFDITLADESPRFFYCKQANKTPNSHCGRGMVFAINVDGATFAQYQANAAVDGIPKIKGRSAAALNA